MANDCYNTLTLTGEAGFITDLHARFLSAPKDDDADGWTGVLAEMLRAEGWSGEFSRYPFHTEMDAPTALNDESELELRFVTKWSPDLEFVEVIATSLPFSTVRITADESGNGVWEDHSWSYGSPTSWVSAVAAFEYVKDEIHETIHFAELWERASDGLWRQEYRWMDRSADAPIEFVDAVSRVLSSEGWDGDGVSLAELHAGLAGLFAHQVAYHGRFRFIDLLPVAQSSPQALAALVTHMWATQEFLLPVLPALLSAPEWHPDFTEGVFAETVGRLSDRNRAVFFKRVVRSHPVLEVLDGLPTDLWVTTARPVLLAAAPTAETTVTAAV